MFIGLILGFVIGGVIGFVTAYFTQQSLIQSKEKEIEQSQEKIKDLEADFDTLFQEKIDALQAEHRLELSNKLDTLKQQYETRIQRIENHQKENKSLIPKVNLVSKNTSSQANLTAEINPDEEPTEIGKTHTKQNIANFPDLEEEPTKIDASPNKTFPLTQDPDEEVTEIDTRFDCGSSKVQNNQDKLEKQLLAGKNYSQLVDIAVLKQHIYHSDSHIRQLVASTLGDVIQGMPFRVEFQGVITSLEKLCRDPEPTVRLAAIKSLGNIKSAKVIYLLKSALRDTNSDVVKAASEIISRYKSYPKITKRKTIKNKHGKKPKFVHKLK